MFQIIPWKNIRRFINKVFKQPGYSVQVSIKRMKSYISYYFGNGRSSYPEALTLFLTHRCNLRCKMCGQWGEGGVTKNIAPEQIRKELVLDEFKILIDDVGPFRPNITLFGGEPLLHPDCVDIIRYIKQNKMHCLMITNGSLLERYAGALVDAGLDELNVSLDGSGALHDEIRGMPGLFDRIMKGLREINTAKKEKHTGRPLINLQCTITKYNYKHLEELIKVAEDINAGSITYHNLIFLGKDLIEKQKKHDEAMNCTSVDWHGFVFEPGVDPEELYSKMKSIMSQRHRFSVDFYPNFSLKGLREYYNNPSYLPSEYSARCISPWMVAYVFPDGKVTPCLNFSYAYGNLKEKKFTQLWNNDIAVGFRRYLRQNNIFPVCVRCTELYRY